MLTPLLVSLEKVCNVQQIDVVPYTHFTFSGLNVEQRKRLTIGVELAAKPKLLLFLDEPTSGLDSQTAWSICTLLRDLANNGQAILCTIHQVCACYIRCTA
jgi:ABC-type multidrug transport system ATPase subunit